MSTRYRTTSLLILPIVLLLSGCCTGPRDVVAATQPGLDAFGSTLQISANGPAFAFYVSAIEGPDGKHDYAMAPVNGFYPLTPGVTTLTIKSTSYDITSPAIDPEKLVASLHFIAAPGVPYTLAATDVGDAIQLSIIERNTLRSVTPEVSLPISRPPAAP